MPYLIEHRCDAEIGRVGNYHGCKRLAKIAIQGRYSIMHYCLIHAKRAFDLPGRYFVRAPLEKPYWMDNFQAIDKFEDIKKRDL